MRKLFPGYYRPTDQEFSKMWQECTFAFDANVLLNIYRYSHETRESLFEILKRLKDRIWVPHQAACEYQERRLDVISEQFKAYEETEELLSKTLRQLENRRHPFIDFSKLAEIIEDTIERAKAVLQEARSRHPDLLESDDLRETITELLEGKVGDPYSEEELDRIYKKAEQRFTQKTPPGYKDTAKQGPRRYGDVVLWFQLIDHAKSQKKPLIFVTDDRKEDWWLRREGEIVGPRPELIQEMSSQAGVSFYMYQTDQFINYAQDLLELQDQRAAVEEIREIGQQDEIIQRMRELIGKRFAAQFAEEILRSTAKVSQRLAEAMWPVISTDVIQQLAEVTPYPTIPPDVIQRLAEVTALDSGEEAMQGLSEPNQEEGKDESSGDEADRPSDQKTDNNGEGEENNLSDG